MIKTQTAVIEKTVNFMTKIKMIVHLTNINVIQLWTIQNVKTILLTKN